MTEKEDEVELDLEAGAKVLAGKALPKKKPRAKAKQKRLKDDGSKSGAKSGQSGLPLSLLPPAEEDLTQYSFKLTTNKNEIDKAQPYKITKHYKVGDIMNHKTFGIGFVVTESGKNKIEVLFHIGRKLLVNGQK